MQKIERKISQMMNEINISLNHKINKFYSNKKNID